MGFHFSRRFIEIKKYMICRKIYIKYTNIEGTNMCIYIRRSISAYIQVYNYLDVAFQMYFVIFIKPCYEK